MAGGEAVRAESGAMMATSDGVAVEAKMQGGWVDCAANLPGDAIVRTVGGGKTLNLSRGAFLVCESGVEIDTQWGGFKNLSGGEGGFLVHASGEGEVVAACYGALDTITLGPGEKVVVDSGHMVAYDDTVQMSTRRVAGTVASMKSGEGLVLEFTGPGEVLTQTRNPSALISWLTTALPFTRQ
jgi:uncharacterized protein (TIGR00266 family)